VVPVPFTGFIVAPYRPDVKEKIRNFCKFSEKEKIPLTFEKISHNTGTYYSWGGCS
jgi:hypothetical protein